MVYWVLLEEEYGSTLLLGFVGQVGEPSGWWAGGSKGFLLNHVLHNRIELCPMHSIGQIFLMADYDVLLPASISRWSYEKRRQKVTIDTLLGRVFCARVIHQRPDACHLPLFGRGQRADIWRKV